MSLEYDPASEPLIIQLAEHNILNPFLSEPRVGCISPKSEPATPHRILAMPNLERVTSSVFLALQPGIC